MNILLVDDEYLELEQLDYLIKEYLPSGKIFKASDAVQALAIAKKSRIDLALLDIQMPGKTGLTLAQELKALYELDIVMVTAYQDFDYAQHAIRIGVSDYITKPIIEEELVRTLNKFISWSTVSEMVQRTLNIIHERFSEKLTVNAIAEEIFVHPSHLSRRFLEEQQIGISEYISNYRLEHAARMLQQQPKMSISQIAEHTGYASQHYFSISFKKKYAVSPREYRTQRL